MSIIVYLLITMAFSAFFSGMEIAFVSVDKLRFELERKGGLSSRILSVFFKNPNDFISTMLVGNNVALVIYGILMAQIIGDNLLSGFITNHFLMVLVQTIISTLIILVTGEFLPKTLFKINPNLVLNVCAVPLFICYIILYPISKLSSGLSYMFLRLFGMKINKEASAKAFGKVDLDYFVQSGIDNADNSDELDTEVKIFQNALDFSTIKIRDCIVPRTEVVAVDLSTSLEDDNTSYICKQIGEGEYVLSGRLEIEKVNETFDLDLPEADDYLTIGGLILSQYQSFPKLHEIISVGCYQFKIIKVTPTKIELVRLKVME